MQDETAAAHHGVHEACRDSTLLKTRSTHRRSSCTGVFFRNFVSSDFLHERDVGPFGAQCSVVAPSVPFFGDHGFPWLFWTRELCEKTTKTTKKLVQNIDLGGRPTAYSPTSSVVLY